MCLMRLDGFLDDPKAMPDGQVDSIERTALDLVFEEVRLRARRLCEALTLLVLFAQTNEEAYFRHFLLLQSYLGGRWFNEELREFHGAPSAWVNRTLDMELADIHEVEKQIDATAMWYAKYSFPLIPKKGSWKGIQTSQRERFMRALPQMRDFERMALGGAYDEAFSKPSASIHFSGASLHAPLSKSLETELGQLGILAFCVASRCYELLGEPRGDAIEKIHTGVTSNEKAPSLLQLLNVRPGIKVGDFVAARGLLGEVLEIAESDYQYRSFRVLFLDERPLPDLTEDWFRARDVALFFSREKLDEGVKQLVGRAGDADDYRSAVRETWRLRDTVLARRPTDDDGPK
jgi:hypothetical protein